MAHGRRAGIPPAEKCRRGAVRDVAQAAKPAKAFQPPARPDPERPPDSALLDRSVKEISWSLRKKC
jgi:hypothetical protein